MCFLIKCSVAASIKKNCMTFTSIFARIQDKFYMGNIHARLGPVVVANIVLHFCQLCEYIQLDFKCVPDDKPVQMYFKNDMYLMNQEIIGQFYFLN